MKTATIHITHLWGTNQYVVDVMYRGNVLKTFIRGDLETWRPLSDLPRIAEQWALRNGFTHCKHSGVNFK